MEHEALANLQAELFQTRVTLNQLRVELNHNCSDSRTSTDDLDNVIARTAHAVADLDNVTSRIHRRLA